MPARLPYLSLPLSFSFFFPRVSRLASSFFPSSPSSSIGSALSRRMRTSGDAAASHRALHGMHYGTSEQRLCRKNCGHARRTRSVNRLPPLSPSIPFTARAESSASQFIIYAGILSNVGSHRARNCVTFEKRNLYNFSLFQYHLRWLSRPCVVCVYPSSSIYTSPHVLYICCKRARY